MPFHSQALSKLSYRYSGEDLLTILLCVLDVWRRRCSRRAAVNFWNGNKPFYKCNVVRRDVSVPWDQLQYSVCRLRMKECFWFPRNSNRWCSSVFMKYLMIIFWDMRRRLWTSDTSPRRPTKRSGWAWAALLIHLSGWAWRMSGVAYKIRDKM